MKNKAAFKALEMQKTDIEAQFGAPLDWQPLPDSEGCRVRFIVAGGYKSPADHWPQIHAALVDALVRLEATRRQRVAHLVY